MNRRRRKIYFSTQHTMKEKFTVFAAALFMLAACQAEPQITQEIAPAQASEQPQTVEEGVVPPEVTASQENGAPTKSLIEVDGEGVGTIYWTPSDEINVFYGSTSTRYISKNTENATTAVFRTLDVIGTTESATENIWGLYPYNENASCTGSAVTTTLPANQKGVPGTFDDDLYITLAHNTSTALVFWNVCGGIKFSLSRNDITSITFRGNNNEDIAGDISLTFDGETNFPVATVLNGAKEITLTPKTGTTFASGENYYLILLPGTLENGFTMTFTTTDASTGTFNYTDKAVTIKRSVFSKKAEIDTYAVFSLPSNVIKYTSTDGNIVEPNSPSSYFGANVISNTYENGEGTIIFDAPVTKLGNSAFASKNNLQTITLPSSISEVNNYAFSESTLTHFYGPLAGADNRSLVIDGQLIYVATYGITSYTIPAGVRIIGRRAFDHNTPTTEQIKTVTIPEGVEIIQQDGLYGTNLTSVRLPSTITELGQQWHGGNVIESISFPASVLSIGRSGARQFKVVEFNRPVPALLGENVFGTTTIIYVPNGTLETYQAAWPEYASRIREKTSNQPLNEIWYTTVDGKPARSDRANPNIVPEWKQNIISNSDGRMVFDAPLTRIPYDAFENSNIETVSLPDAMTYLGNNSFQLSTSLKEVHLGRYLEEMTWASFNGCSALTTINIPPEITYIEGKMFSGCTSLSSITIPDGVTKIGEQAFDYCTSLETIVFPNSVTTIYGCLSGCTGLTSVTLPNAITSIPSGMFSRCSSLTTVAIPESVTSIDGFAGSGITSITLPNNLTSIAYNAFRDCVNLSSIVIPATVTEISHYAFWGCSGLNQITVLPTNPPTARDSIFWGSSCPIYVPAGSVDTYKAASGWSAYATRIQAIQ